MELGDEVLKKRVEYVDDDAQLNRILIQLGTEDVRLRNVADGKEMSQKQLAETLGISRVRLSEIIRGKRAITPDTAFRLARLFGTTPEFWIGLQADVSLWDTLQVHGAEYEKIKPVRAAVD